MINLTSSPVVVSGAATGRGKAKPRPGSGSSHGSTDNPRREINRATVWNHHETARFYRCRRRESLNEWKAGSMLVWMLQSIALDRLGAVESMSCAVRGSATRGPAAAPATNEPVECASSRIYARRSPLVAFASISFVTVTELMCLLPRTGRPQKCFTS